LWTYFLWKYEKIYWSFFCVSCGSDCSVAEFYGVIHIMEETQKMRFTNVWLECDSALVCGAFTARKNVLWMLRNR